VARSPTLEDRSNLSYWAAELTALCGPAPSRDSLPPLHASSQHAVVCADVAIFQSRTEPQSFDRVNHKSQHDFLGVGMGRKPVVSLLSWVGAGLLVLAMGVVAWAAFFGATGCSTGCQPVLPLSILEGK
jgi:hypothetical protein